MLTFKLIKVRKFSTIQESFCHILKPIQGSWRWNRMMQSYFLVKVEGKCHGSRQTSPSLCLSSYILSKYIVLFTEFNLQFNWNEEWKLSLSSLLHKLCLFSQKEINHSQKILKSGKAIENRFGCFVKRNGKGIISGFFKLDLKIIL